MVQIVMGKLANRNLDGSNQKAVMNFLLKLSQDDTHPSLRVKPLTAAADPRVRTARVNDDMRAVLFKLEEADEPTYVLHGVWPHDEGNRIAATIKADLSPTTGQFVVTHVESPAAEAQTESPAATGPAGLPAAYSQGADLTYSWLGSYGYTAENLEEYFGLPTDVARRAIEQESAEDLLEFAGGCFGWIQSVLLQLSVGDSREEILDQLGLTVSPEEATPAATDTPPSDEQLVDALRTDIGRAEYTFIEGEDELRSIIESGSFGEWRRFLHPEQRRYVTVNTNGPFRLSGAAGTGKTVVLLHRTKELAERNPEAKIILTTFNRTLAEGLEDQLLFLDPDIRLSQMGEPGVCVRGVDALANEAISNACKRGNTARLEDAMTAVLGAVRTGIENRPEPDWRAAVASSGADPTLPYLQPAFLRAEYDEVVLPGKITTMAQYARVRRPGRGIGLNRAQRLQVWAVIEAYRAEAQVAGGLTFPEVAAVASELMRKRIEEGDPYYADHLLIDEGQDLSAVQWQFLRGLVPSGPDDMFIAEDSEQRIYGRQLVLSHFGVKITGRSRRLTLNYRTTAQNLRRAVLALEGQTVYQLEGEEVESSQYRSARQGPEPEDLNADSFEDGAKAILERVEKWVEEDGVEPETIGVLAPYRASVERIVDVLAGAGIAARVVTRDSSGTGSSRSSGVQGMTMHRAKGLEFIRVALILEPIKPVWDLDEAEQKARSLAYVAMTRARDQLLVVHI